MSHIYMDERRGVWAIALLADKKRFTPSEAIGVLATDRRMWDACTTDVHSGTGLAAGYWVVPLATGSPNTFWTRPLREFEGNEGAPDGVFIAYV